MSKKWARGLTADTDARIARSARAHKGLKYQRRTPLELCNWWRGPRLEIGPIPWSPKFAYAAGLFATDGSMSTRRGGQPGHMSISSKDKKLVETFLHCVDKNTKVRLRRRQHWGRTWIGYETTFVHVRLFRWYESIGITPRKSLTLGRLEVPEALFPHLVRGLLDGDGSVARYTDRRGRRCFSLRFHSASEAHVAWLREKITENLGIGGALNKVVRRKGLGRRPMYQLAYGKEASRILAAFIYADPSAPRLERKWLRWVAEMRANLL